MLSLASLVGAGIFSWSSFFSNIPQIKTKCTNYFIFLKQNKTKTQPHRIQFCSLLIGQPEVMELDDGCVAVKKRMREDQE